MKWKTTKHRHEDSSQSTSSTSSAGDMNDEQSQAPAVLTSLLLPTVDILLGRDAPPHPTPKSSPRLGQLLIAKDIEAILEEDERVRAQQRQEQQDREAKLGRLDRVALSEDPCQVVRALPPPPRRLPPTRHNKFRSDIQTPISSGQISSSNIVKEGETRVRRPSATGGVGSSPSVSSRPSIKDMPADLGSARRMSGTETYARIETSSVSRLSEFGPRSSRRSPDGPERRSWSTASGFSGTTQASISSGLSPSGLADKSRSTAMNPSRPLLSQAFFKSQESIYSAASSIDPASTVHEPRISISSTIYPPSAYDELPSPVAGPVGSDQLGAGHRDSLFYTEADSVCDEDDQRHSVVDTSTQTSVECETPVPQRTAFAPSEGIYPISDKLINDAESGVLPHRPLSTSSDVSTRRSSGQKPALPTAPKPDFRRSRSVQPPSRIPMISKPPSRSSSPKLPALVPYHLLTSFSPSDSNRNDSLPPTTNFLNPQERSDLIRKARKLAQVLGQTPSPLTGPEEPTDSPVLNNCLLPVMPSRKAHARAVSDALGGVSGSNRLREPQFPTVGAGRTGSLSPIRFRSSSSGMGNDSDDSLSPYDSPDAATPLSSRKKSGDAFVRSPTIVSASDSFIELVDESPSLVRFPSICSFNDNLTDEQRAEEERRRKREKLARLHRFLGSRVPLELVLGHGLEIPLPPLASDSKFPDTASDGEVSPATKRWLPAKRRNSLPTCDTHERLPDSDRLKEELSDKEKAAAVKRALKMEKMFGEQPPQDLFHSGKARTVQHRSTARTMSDSKVAALSAPSSPVSGNVNKSAYRKQKLKRNNRPGTAESAKRLLGPGPEIGETESINDGQSDMYYHYRNSLVSLTNIVDNDDKKSLVELHEYINEDPSTIPRDKRESYSNGSIRSERRRSLPLRASYSSLVSQYTISEAKLETSPFEVRRRRAAKLSHFFGVSYRDLFGQVLDSLEMSVREDEGKGTLNADEAKDLLVQLTKLKARRDELS